MTPQVIEPGLLGLAPLDDGPGPALAISSKRAAALIEGAIAAAAAEATSAAQRAPRWSSRGWSRQRWQMAAAAGLLAIAGVAAAALYGVRGHRLPAVTQPAAVEQLAAPAAREPAAGAGSGGGAEAPSTSALPGSPARARPAGAGHQRGAEDLLQAANEHRRQRRWQEADRIYQRVMRAYPGSAAAHVAQMASAALHLEHLGQPQAALRLYQGAVAAQPRGPLAEEARYGLAESYRALGDGAGEARALRALLRGLGQDSPLRLRAEQRLRALADGAAPGR